MVFSKSRLLSFRALPLSAFPREGKGVSLVLGGFKMEMVHPCPTHLPPWVGVRARIKGMWKDLFKLQSLA
jgi:hypothetical protein